MHSRPYVLLSVATSLDGYVDDASPRRLLLSNDADFDRVDEVRASVDAILVGAGTIRADNPRLLVRSAERRRARLARGLVESPAKVTLTSTGDLDPATAFFTAGEAARLVYTADAAEAVTRARLGAAATVVGAGDPLDLRRVLTDLAERGVGRLMVEGGGAVNTAFLAGGLVDEMQLVVAPFLVGDPAAPRFVGAAAFPQDAAHRMTLAEVRRIGDAVLLRYFPRSPAGVAEADRRRLREAVTLADQSSPSRSAFSVGAVVVAADGSVLATGYSREHDSLDHAEEVALAKLWDVELSGATIYTSMEPCSSRASRPASCTELILRAGISRVVYAWPEPALFADCHGVELLRAAGVETVEVPELAADVRRTNAHLAGVDPA